MKPINQAERKSAISKFFLFLFLSVGVLILPFLLYFTVPKTAPSRAATPAPPPVEQPVDTAGVADLRGKLNSLAESLQQVNIMFVVDATQGMENHLPAVGRAAQQIDNEYSVEMKAACYRDAAEGAWLYMDNETVGEAPSEWLSSLDTKSQFDRDEPEALYYGLLRGLQSRYLRPGETNIVVLVGDAGNHAQESLTDIPPENIVELLQQKNCHFAALQVRNPNSDPIYAEFASQMLEDIFKPIKSNLEQPLQEEDRSDDYGSSYRLTGGTDNLLYITNPDKTLPPDELTAKIEGFVQQVLSPLPDQIAQIQALAEGDESAEPDQSLLDLLARYQITGDQLDRLKK